jgi:acyl-CoA thioesterase-1
VNRRRFLARLASLPFTASLGYAQGGDSVPTIVCLGDSITAGYGLDPGHSYPDYLQADLQARGYRYRVVNQGISGDTTKDALDRLNQTLALHPAVAIVELGGNDGLRGLPVTATRQNLDAIVRAIRASGSKVIVAGITLPPNYGQDYISQFNAIFPAVATKYHAALLPMLYAHVYDQPGAVQEDGVHPTAKGARLIADNLLPLLLPLLRKSATAKP